ncbi:MAG: GNAT family N-acetyltransferase [Spirochaetaceae bacterium]|nr:GNAT family N-acetyltransferase [Spirochaetaceae bacterium]
MITELTSELTDEIIYAMENQSGAFVFDSIDGVILPESEVVSSDENRYYKLRVWNSASGFRMMEHFVASLKNPPVCEELRSILKSGNGVFRKFKNVLKVHPDVERLWFSFKEHEMKQVILSWFDDLRELWGLERLELEPEENEEELLHDDFLFRLAAASGEQAEKTCEEELLKEFEDFYGTDLGDVLSEQWKKVNDSSKGFRTVVFCETVSGEPVGFAAGFKTSADSSVIMISVLFVIPRFRGLGLGKELLEFLLEQFRDGTVKSVAVSCSIIPDFFKKILEREGFSQLGSVFLLRVPLEH